MQVAWAGVIIEAFQEKILPFFEQNCYPSVVCSVAAFGGEFLSEPELQLMWGVD